MNDADTTNPAKPRKRGLTSLTLGWLADRFRRAQVLKEKIENGTYSVDSKKVAASLVNEE